MHLFKKRTKHIAGSQAMRLTFRPRLTGFRMVKGHVVFFTVSPDRRRSALLLRVMRARQNDTYLLAAEDNTARQWRKQFAGANEPRSLDAGDFEEVSMRIGYDRFPSVTEMIAMAANDPLATIMHFQLCLKISLPLLLGLRTCLHCPTCSNEDKFDYYTTMDHGRRKSCFTPPCQDEFGCNTRVHGGTFAFCDGYTYVLEHQGNDTPHGHGVFSLATPYQRCSLQEIADRIEKNTLNVESIKRFTAHMCREEHFNHASHTANLTTLEDDWKNLQAGKAHVKLFHRPSFM